jgi:hypothetical protein
MRGYLFPVPASEAPGAKLAHAPVIITALAGNVPGGSVGG